jgi:hypothetical protein
MDVDHLFAKDNLIKKEEFTRQNAISITIEKQGKLG